MSTKMEFNNNEIVFNPMYEGDTLDKVIDVLEVFFLDKSFNFSEKVQIASLLIGAIYTRNEINKLQSKQID